MYLDELLEDATKQAGARFYPDSRSESYIVVRRAGTMAHRKAESLMNAKYPPLELLHKEARNEQAIEKTNEIVRDYFVADMVGFKDTETGEYVNYKKQKSQIFYGNSNETLGLINSILTFANDYKNYTKLRNQAAKEALEKYINVNIIEEADNQDWLALWHNRGEQEYNEIRGELTPELNALLHVYFDLKRDARGELITRPEICKAAVYVDYDFDDCVDILLHIDDYYTKRENEKLKAKADAQAKARR